MDALAFAMRARWGGFDYSTIAPRGMLGETGNPLYMQLHEGFFTCKVCDGQRMLTLKASGEDMVCHGCYEASVHILKAKEHNEYHPGRRFFYEPDPD